MSTQLSPNETAADNPSYVRATKEEAVVLQRLPPKERVKALASLRSYSNRYERRRTKYGRTLKGKP